LINLLRALQENEGGKAVILAESLSMEMPQGVRKLLEAFF